jgi:RNA polymerase sigma-70 factor (ECF subfamily)
LGILIARYQATALRLAFLLTGDQMVAEDILQEAFIAAYRAIAQFDLSRPFTPWFYRIVTNTARMYQRLHERHPTVSLDKVTEPNELVASHPKGPIEPEDYALRQELHHELGEILAALTTAQREVIVLRYYYGLTDEEIAKIVGCRVPAARQRLYGGLRALKKLIAQRSPWLLQDTATSPAPRVEAP